MNKLTKEDRIRVVACLVERNSLRATVRMTGVHRTTIQKIYGNAGVQDMRHAEVRYSPAVCMGARKAVISGQPDYRHVSTSFAERQNLTMRMSMRRNPSVNTGGASVPASRSQESLGYLAAREYARPT